MNQSELLIVKAMQQYSLEQLILGRSGQLQKNGLFHVKYANLVLR